MGAPSFLRYSAVITSVTASVTGDAIQMPFIPKNTGSTKMQMSSTTSPRDDEMTADSFALPIEVK